MASVTSRRLGAARTSRSVVAKSWERPAFAPSPVFAGLAAIGLVPLYFYMRSLREGAKL